MNILATGGLDYIDSHTSVALIEAGYHPIIDDNLSNAKKQVFARICQITNKHVMCSEDDVRDEKALSDVFEVHQFKYVTYFAGLKVVGESIQIPMNDYDVNVDGTLTHLREMQNHHTHKLIFSSSATIYGTPSASPIVESDPTGKTVSPYGSDSSESTFRWVCNTFTE